jgi:hypothetical protein
MIRRIYVADGESVEMHVKTAHPILDDMDKTVGGFATLALFFF